MDRERFPGSHGCDRHSLEHQEVATASHSSAIHWLRLASRFQGGEHSSRQARPDLRLASKLARTKLQGVVIRSSQFAWQTHIYFLHLPSPMAFPPLDRLVCRQIPVNSRTPVPHYSCAIRHSLDTQPAFGFTKPIPTHSIQPSGSRLVGRREHIVWHWGDDRRVLGRLEMGRGCEDWPKTTLRHWLGRSCGSRTGTETSTSRRLTIPRSLSGSLRQCWSSGSTESWTLTQPRDKQGAQEYLWYHGIPSPSSDGSVCVNKGQRDRHRRIVSGRYQRFLSWFPKGSFSFASPTTTPPFPSSRTILAFPVNLPPAIPAGISSLVGHEDTPSPQPSSLRPACRAEERIFQWKGINVPPPSTINHPVIRMISSIASEASLRDAKGYGAAIRKFHIFCDVFSISEQLRLPASFELIHSFALWAATDPEAIGPSLLSDIPFETVSVSTV